MLICQIKFSYRIPVTMPFARPLGSASGAMRLATLIKDGAGGRGAGTLDEGGGGGVRGAEELGRLPSSGGVDIDGGASSGRRCAPDGNG